ncbi:hypothetical protein DFJ58DRAFT_892478 [Suillus subalutaceus]|uniref:uncharacterized protein n=1 Tax=Suillus subalutaceus TaxID=48586 RepID=UPI001B86BDE6|nr:uncharacterized protein DFJ58DRAFT_892478 [Suillus subalutaceus]KAG1871221.1 hypothetical protein DFJ58DRAFT_892478 [Suillus subalutaceus]
MADLVTHARFCRSVFPVLLSVCRSQSEVEQLLYEDLRTEDSREQTPADSLFRDEEATAPNAHSPISFSREWILAPAVLPRGSPGPRKTALLHRNQRRFLMTGTIFYDVHRFHERLHRWSHVYSEKSETTASAELSAQLEHTGSVHSPPTFAAPPPVLRRSIIRDVGIIHTIKLVLLLVPDSAFHMGELVILIGKIWYGFLWFGHLNAPLHQYHDHAT